MKIANAYRKAGDCDSYYTALGDALHATQDQWAQYIISLLDNGWQAYLGHIITELNPSFESQLNAYYSSIILLGGM